MPPEDVHSLPRQGGPTFESDLSAPHRAIIRWARGIVERGDAFRSPAATQRQIDGLRLAFDEMDRIYAAEVAEGGDDAR